MAPTATSRGGAALLKGPQKAALLVVTMGPEAAARLFRNLETEEVERLTLEVSGLGEVPGEVRDAVLREFNNLVMARNYLTSGGVEVAKDILTRALGPDRAEVVLEKVKATVAGEVFQMNMLNEVDSNQLVTFITGEHPQTIALILVQLKSTQAAKVLQMLPTEVQPDVVQRIATMEQISPEMIREIENVLESNLAGMVRATKRRMGGVPLVAEILNQCDRYTEKNIMESVEISDMDLAVQIRNLMFVFEDLLRLDDKDVQRILKDVDSRDLALALKIASEELKEKLFKGLSQRAAEMLRDELEFLGPVPLKNVEEAQRKIVDSVRRLDETGEIHLNRGDQGEQLV